MKKIILSLLFSCLTFYMLIFPENAYQAASDALLLCANALLPTLFVFMVCSNFFVSVGIGKVLKKPLKNLMQPIFGINGAGALAVVMGLISGYPVGASCVCGLYEKKDITKNEAQRLLGFTNNSGPLFIIGSVGAVMLKNKEAGYFLWLVHITAALMSGIVLRVFSRREKYYEQKEEFWQVGLSQAVSDSVKNALGGVLVVCAYTVLFSVIISMMLFVFGENRFTLFFGGIIEMTNAIQKLALTGCDLKSLLPQISFILGFGGLCVHLQVINVTKKSGLNLKFYFLGKFLHAIFSGLISFILTRVII